MCTQGAGRPHDEKRSGLLRSCSFFFMCVSTMGASDCPKNWKKIWPHCSMPCWRRAGDMGDAP